MRDGDWHDYRTSARVPSDVWIVGDGPCVVAQVAASAVGMRIARRLTCAEGFTAFGTGSAGDLVLVELSHALSAAEDDLLDLMATLPGGAAIVSFPLSILDAVVARLWAQPVTLLCEPGVADWIAAMSLASLPVANRLAETNERTEALRLQKLTEEIARIAHALASLADEAAPGQRQSMSDGLVGYCPPPDATATLPVASVYIRTMIRLRRQREGLFGEGLFSDPVWDMMLDLAAARLEGTQVAVSSLCIAAAVPPTTALRWIAMLTATGIIVRVPDPYDRRRVFLELSDAATTTVIDFLGKAKRAGVSLI